MATCPNCGADLPAEIATVAEPHRAPVPSRWRHHPATRTNHLLHGLLTFITAGLWAPIWFFVNERNRERWELL